MAVSACPATSGERSAGFWNGRLDEPLNGLLLFYQAMARRRQICRRGRTVEVIEPLGPETHAVVRVGDETLTCSFRRAGLASADRSAWSWTSPRWSSLTPVTARFPLSANGDLLDAARGPAEGRGPARAACGAPAHHWVPEPEPQPGGVEVAISACGICGTDQHIMSGTFYRPELPFVLGHDRSDCGRVSPASTRVRRAPGRGCDLRRLGRARRAWPAMSGCASTAPGSPGCSASGAASPSASAWPRITSSRFRRADRRGRRQPG